MGFGRAEKVRNSRFPTHMEPDRYSRKTPHVNRIPSKLVHVRQYALDVAYVPRARADKSLRKMWCWIYEVLRAILSANERSEVMRILRKHSDFNWKRLWLNHHTACILDARKSTWYIVVHEHTPTNERLAAIKLTDMNRFITCSAVDTIQHRLTQCGESQVICNWTRARIATITRTHS
jgi:hypothetical protein